MRSLTVADPFALPFTIDAAAADLVLVHVSAHAGDHPLLRDPTGTSWVAAHAEAHIIIDLSDVTLLNSGLCAWLFGLAAACRAGQVLVRGWNQHVRTQMRHMGLDRVLVVS